MLILELDGVEIDQCDRCGGTWMDSGELGLMLERRGSATDRLESALASAVETGRTDRRCPRCRRRLREIAIAPDDPNIFVDRCPRGHGVWCDRDEMAAILGSFAGGSAITSFLGEVYPARKQD